MKNLIADPSRERRQAALHAQLPRFAIAAMLAFSACAHQPPPAPLPVAEAPKPPPPLERLCQDTLPLPERTLGALARLLHRTHPNLALQQRDCRSGDAWPIAYATGDSPDSGKAPIGFEVLRMTGDALLTLDEKNREAPTVNLCRVLEYTLDEDHRVRAVGLWDSSEDGAFDPDHPERSTATLAWVELLSRSPSDCALGVKEAEAGLGDPTLRTRLQCADTPLVLRDLSACEQPAVFAITPEPDAEPDARAIERMAAANHRFRGAGRAAIDSPHDLALKLVQPELCLYEPPPAARDVCLAEYSGPDRERWYGRGDVTRSGDAGMKNYVDSYLTFVLLKRIEAERKGAVGKK